MGALPSKRAVGSAAAVALLGVACRHVCAASTTHHQPLDAQPETQPETLTLCQQLHGDGTSEQIREADCLVCGRAAAVAKLSADPSASHELDIMVADLDSCLENMLSSASLRHLASIEAILGLASGPLLQAAATRAVMGMWACRMLQQVPERPLVLEHLSLQSVGHALRAAPPDGDAGCAAAALLLRLCRAPAAHGSIVAEITQHKDLASGIRHSILHGPEQAAICVLLAALHLRCGGRGADLGAAFSNVAVATAIMPRSPKHPRTQQPLVRACAATLAYADGGSAATKQMINDQRMMTRRHADMLLADGLKSKGQIDVPEEWTFDFSGQRSVLCLEAGLTTGAGAQQAALQLAADDQ